MNADWKQEHANASDKALTHEMVTGVIDELMDNIRSNYGDRAASALTRYGISKVAMYAAQVARAQALGFDPNLLRMTPEEANSDQLRIAAEAALAGVPVSMLPADSSTWLICPLCGKGIRPGIATVRDTGTTFHAECWGKTR